MEHAVRLEVASQKSLHAVFDVLTEKSMRRFGMVAAFHFRKIEPGAVIRTWKETETAGYTVTYYDVGNRPVWMAVWSTVFLSGNAEDMWGETERFARDFNRDTVLFSVDDEGGAHYRFYSPDRDARAWVEVEPGGGMLRGAGTEQFFQGLVKRCRRGALELEPLRFAGRAEACAYLDRVFGFQPLEMPEHGAVLEAAKKGALTDPFGVIALVYDPAYLAYDPRAAYEEVMCAVEGVLKPLGFHRKDMNFYRLWADGAYMECLNVQKKRFVVDRTHEMGFTVNISRGAAAEHGRTSWCEKDFKGMDMAWGKRIGHLAWGYDHWYELYPGADTQEVTKQVLSDLKTALAYLEELRSLR